MADTKDPTATATATEGRKESNGHASDASAPAVVPSGTNANASSDASPASIEAEEQQLSDWSQPSSKKRRSAIQLNKDDHPEGLTFNSEDGDALNDDGGKRSDPFKRASADIMKKRKIIKVSSKWTTAGTGVTSGGATFASVKLAPASEGKLEIDSSPSEPNNTTSTFGLSAKSTFGSTAKGAVSSGVSSVVAKSPGFGSGFVSISLGFGALKPTYSKNDNFDNDEPKSALMKSTTFGGGFGGTSTGFGSLKSTMSSGFDSPANENATSSPNIAPNNSCGSGLAGTLFVKSPNKLSSASPAKFPTSSVVDTANGEQDEDCLCQVRAKLFKMVLDDEMPTTAQDSSALKGDVPSVPSTSGRMDSLKAKKEDTEESKGSKETSEKAKKSTKVRDSKKLKLIQKEAGIGPVRVLKRKPPMRLGGHKDPANKCVLSSRVVQRQETSGGQATRVILNIRLIPKTCNVIRRGDLFVQLNAPNSNGALESSLFKVKTSVDADTLEKNLKAVLGE